MMYRSVLLFVLLSVGGAAAKPVPTGVVFQKDTLYRSDGRGDNWCQTWMGDDSIVTSMCDGNWLRGKTSYHVRLYRITGGPKNLSRREVEGYPDYTWGKGSWFGYGIVAVDGALYSAISKTPANHWSGPFRGVKLLKSTDNGRSWYRVSPDGGLRRIEPLDDARNEVTKEEMFFFEESGRAHKKQKAYPFSFFDFVQQGSDYGAAKDGYLYIYSPEGAHSNELLLARIPTGKLDVRNQWEYFKAYGPNGPAWTDDIEKRGYVHRFPEKSEDGKYFGWYSWLPSVVYNKALDLYIMVNGGTYGGRDMTESDKDYYDRWMHTRTGSLGLWYAEHPWGPWKRFFYTDYWTVDDPGNRTYQPKLSPKWISDDGREMTLIWSDAMRNEAGKSHTVNYKWNQMRIRIETE